MKKCEKIMTGIFVTGIIAFISDFLYEVVYMQVEADDRFFYGITVPLSVIFVISFFGLMTLLVRVWLRKRSEAGKKPISNAYRLSFLLSFIPFILLVISSLQTSEFSFMGTVVATGAEAAYDTFFFGVLMYCSVIPIFPVVIFWQILYIINRIKYRKEIKTS